MVRIKKKYIKYVWFYITKIHNFRMFFNTLYIKILHRASDEYTKSELAKNKFTEQFIKLDYGKFILSPSFSSWFIVAPYYESETRETMYKIANESDSKNKIFLNVGANIGLFIVQFGKYFKKNIAIEADHINFKYLKCNVILNDLEEKTELINKAAGDETCDVYFYHNYWTDINSKVVQDPKEVPEKVRNELVKLRIEPVDEILKNVNGKDIKLAVVDVEGFELKVLSGMKRLINEMEKNSYIIVEIPKEEMKEGIFKYLKENSFEFEKNLDERNYLFKKV